MIVKLGELQQHYNKDNITFWIELENMFGPVIVIDLNFSFDLDCSGNPF